MRVHGRRIASSLLPYALASVAVVLASAIAITTTIRPGPTGLGAPGASAEPTAAPRAQGAPDARMAYWRAAANGVLELWVSDLDGDHRSRIATAGADTDLSLTHWSPDGSAVAYTIAGTTIGMAWLDASNATLPMPSQLRAARWKIVTFEWSPDARRIAATFRAGSGLSNESDVYVAESRASATWERVTTMGDAYAGRWIDAERFFVETSSGMIAVLDVATRALRPITGMPATSPIVGRDGRVYFTGGRSVAADVASQPVASGWVWSVTIDGDDLRRETAADQAQARLFGLLADGRAVTGVPGGVYLAGDALVPLAFVVAGTVRRVVVSDDGRRVIGITDSRILRIAASKMPRSLALGSLPPATAATTLLSGLRDAAVWAAQKAVSLARAGSTPPAGPKAKLAFVLGRALWQMDPDGTVRQLLAGEPGRSTALPKVAPTGDRLAVISGPLGTGGPADVVVIGPAGVMQRWQLPSNAQGMEWSPDGRSLAFWSAVAPRFDEWTTQVYDADTGRPVERIPGRATWTSEGRTVLSDGEPDLTAGVRTGQRIDVIEGSSRRTVTDARRLAAAPLLRDLPDATLPALISQVTPLGDRQYIAVSVSRARQAGISSAALVVVRRADGEPIWALGTDPRTGPSDMTASPVGHLFGWTIVSEASTPSRNAVVVDPLANGISVIGRGRFAGWSPDGAWAYVARDEGLFAYRIGGAGDPVRISSIGVPVVATNP